MKGHFVLHEASVLATAEWSVNVPGWLFLQVLHGGGCAFREKTVLLFEEGDALVYAPGQACQLRASQLGDVCVRYFQILPERLTGVLSASERQFLENLAHQDGFPRHLAATSLLAKRYGLLKEHASNGHGLLARCEMLQLLSLLLTDHLLPTDASPHVVLTSKERFEKLVKETVESELYHQPLEDLARQCGCSVRHFSRLYREHFGHSLVPKRIELSLHKAKQLLEESDSKIIDVAMDSGFNHVGQFTSRFKKLFGYTPSEWRSRKADTGKAKSKRNGRVLVSPQRLLERA